MKYKNIKINFTKIEREGRIGTSKMTVSSNLAWDFYNAYEKSDQIFDLIVWTLRPKEEFISKNPDLQVMLYKFMLENPQKEFEIKVETEDRFWIYHDIAHSQKDVEDFNVHIFAENEEERLKETVDLMQEDISTELKKEIETEYFKSFGIMKKLFLLLTTFMFISCQTEGIMVEDKKPNILIVGNSIVLYPEGIYPGWNHNHGMAATSEDTDFYGVIRNAVPHNHIERFNLWAWEGSWDYVSIGRKTQSCDILIVKVGENVVDIPNFKRELNNLVNFYKDNNTKVIIVSTAIAGLLHPTDNMMEEFCAKRGYAFVDLRDMQKDVTNFALAEWEDGAIGCHPSDKGMKYMADKIIEKINN